MRNPSLFSCVVLLALASAASAHHSKTAHYDTSRTVAITGKVVQWRFRSPHTALILEVTAEDGSTERWLVEGSAVPTLKRQGIDRRTFARGDIVDVRAEPSRDPEKRVVFGLTYRKADGTVLGERREVDEAAELDAHIQGVQRLAGRWEGLGFGERFPMSLSAAGQEARDNYDDARSPANTCEPVNLPTILHVPNFLFDIRINDDEVILYHEIYQVVRKVPLGSEAQQAEPTGAFGSVRGRTDGDVLVVESSEYPASLWGLGIAAIKGSDIPASDQKRVTERYISRDDGQTLRVEYMVEDPVYLSEPYQGYRDFGRISDDTPMHPYGCDTESASRFTESLKQE